LPAIVPRRILSLLLTLLTLGVVSIKCQTLSAAPWPEADSLFRKDRSWLGADDAYSLDLGKGRVLWLFADSFVALTAAGSRHESTMVRNTIAIQQGYDPSRASIKFYWRTEDGKPASFFRENGDTWYWPGDAILAGGRLLIFLMRIHAVKTAPGSEAFGFEAFGWTVVAVDNPQDEPARWRTRVIDGAPNGLNVIVGSGGVLRSGGFVYAFGAREPGGKHDVYLVRWPIADAAQGNLQDAAWWCGEKEHWVKQSALKTTPAIVFSNAQTEFTVHWDPRSKRYLEFQTEGFIGAVMSVRWSRTLTGPWSTLESFYRPPESTRAGVFVYAGKAHPELKGADLVLTYASNNSNFGALVDDQTIYYPRFVKANFAANYRRRNSGQ